MGGLAGQGGDVSVPARLAAGAAKISLQLERGQSCWQGGGLYLPLAGSPFPICTAAGFSQSHSNLLHACLAPSQGIHSGGANSKCGFAALGGAGSSPASCHPWVRLLARDLWFGLTKYAPLVKIAPNRWIGRWESYSIKLICKLMNTAMNLVLVWVHGSALERALGWAAFHPRMRFLYR